MATTLRQAAARANAHEFKGRVRMGLVRLAADVIGEAPTTVLPGGGTVGSGAIRDKRHDHACGVLHTIELEQFVARYAHAVVVEPAITAIDQAVGPVTGDEVPDATLFANLRVLFQRFAGVKAGDT